STGSACSETRSAPGVDRQRGAHHTIAPDHEHGETGQMSVPAASVGGRRGGSLVIPILIACVALATLIFLPRLGQSDAVSVPAGRTGAAATAARSIPPFPTRAPAPVWGNAVDAKVRFQQAIDKLPDGAPYVFRVTELAMEPGTRVFDHRQLSVGAHVVVGGTITVNDLDHSTST